MSPKFSLRQTVSFLEQVPQGHLPYELFLQIARLGVLGTVELVPLRRAQDNTTEVLLLKRPQKDIWSNQWHVPGTVMLPTDRVEYPSDYRDPLERLVSSTGELAGTGLKFVHDPVMTETERRVTARGHEIAAIHYVEVAGEPQHGKFFSPDDLLTDVPDNRLALHQYGFIQRAVSVFNEA